MSEEVQKRFIEFAMAQGVLTFGSFTLKSGRVSPYFFNAGLFNSGSALAKVGDFYAETIEENGIEFDLLFGPAYKGIPLATATAVALARNHERDMPYAFNRKEAKDHGEGGTVVGAPLTGRVLIVDDVITAGSAIREVLPMIQGSGAEVAGAIIMVDREERGSGERSAIEEIQEEYGISVISVVKLSHIVGYLKEHHGDPALLDSVREYQTKYGVR